MTSRYTVEQGQVWFYRTEDDQLPQPLLSEWELKNIEGGPQLWESIANMVETAAVQA